MGKDKIFRRRLLTPHRIWLIKREWQTNKWLRLAVLAVILVLAGVLIGGLFPSEQGPVVVKEVQKDVVREVQKEEEPSMFKLSAREAIVVGRYGNALDVDGQYAQIVPDGIAQVSVNPGEGFGNVEIVLPEASISTEDRSRLEGKVKILINRFKPMEEWQEQGILLDQTFFGDTKRGFDLLPETRAFLAVFGEADVFLDDQEVYDNLKGMVLYTEGLRSENYKISSNGQLYTTKRKSDSFSDASDRELHLFIYKDEEDKKNFPPVELWVNVYFEDVRVISVPNGVRK